MKKPTYEELELKLADLREANLALANELENWKIAANNGCGCDTPEGLAAFIINCSDC